MYREYPKREVFEITEFEGMYNLYWSMLVGDRTDNIQGVPGIGPKKAEKILEGLTTEEEMYFAVLKTYIHYHITLLEKHGMEYTTDWVGDTVTEEILETGRLLWMLREPLEYDDNGEITNLWTPPA